MQSALADSDYDLVLFSVDTPEQRDACYARLTRRTRVDGLLSISLPPSAEQARQILEAEVPTVLVDVRPARSEPGDCGRLRRGVSGHPVSS